MGCLLTGSIGGSGVGNPRTRSVIVPKDAHADGEHRGHGDEDIRHIEDCEVRQRDEIDDMTTQRPGSSPDPVDEVAADTGQHHSA